MHLETRNIENRKYLSMSTLYLFNAVEYKDLQNKKGYQINKGCI